jgi:hypothetical protein
MSGLGHTPEPLRVEVGDYGGSVASAEALRDDITEEMWRSGDSISVTVWSHNGPGLQILVGTNYVAPLIVAYHGGSWQERETLRAAVERQLPEVGSDPVRRWRWMGPSVGIAWAGTLVLVSTRVRPVAHVHLHVAETVSVGLWVLLQVSTIGWAVGVTRLALQRLFPALERLPDSGQTRWDRARPWVIFGLGAWLAVFLTVLALPEVNPY